jgi:hypothetical protein
MSSPSSPSGPADFAAGQSSSAESRSRFAELAVELLGSKLATELIRDVWQHANAEVKAELSDAVMGKITARVREMSAWDFDWVIKAEVPKIVAKLKAELEAGTGRGAELAAELETRLLAEMNRHWSSSLTAQIYGLIDQHIGSCLRAKWTELVREHVFAVLKNARATVELGGPVPPSAPAG